MNIINKFNVISTILLLTSGCGNNITHEKDKKPEVKREPFRFRNLVANQTTLNDAIKNKLVESCSQETYDKTFHCESNSKSKGNDIYSFNTVNIIFEDNKFSWMYTDYLHPNNYDQYFKKLEEAYGESCDIKTEELQNAFGAKFHQIKTTWCFSTGELHFNRYDESDITHSELMYFSDRNKNLPPIVASTPDNL